VVAGALLVGARVPPLVVGNGVLGWRRLGVVSTGFGGYGALASDGRRVLPATTTVMVRLEPLEAYPWHTRGFVARYRLASWPRSLASYSLLGGYLGRLAGSHASGFVRKN
jgi:hypothetical protein